MDTIEWDSCAWEKTFVLFSCRQKKHINSSMYFDNCFFLLVSWLFNFIRSTLFIRIRFAYFKRHNDACCLLHRQFHFHRVDKNFTSLDLISFGAKDKRFPLQLTEISWILFAFLCTSRAPHFFSFLSNESSNRSTHLINCLLTETKCALQ